MSSREKDILAALDSEDRSAGPRSALRQLALVERWQAEGLPSEQINARVKAMDNPFQTAKELMKGAEQVLVSFGQGASLGLADDAAAVFGALGSTIVGMGPRAGWDEAKRRHAEYLYQARRDHPLASGAAEVAGGLATSVAAGPALTAYGAGMAGTRAGAAATAVGGQLQQVSPLLRAASALGMGALDNYQRMAGERGNYYGPPRPPDPELHKPDWQRGHYLTEAPRRGEGPFGT